MSLEKYGLLREDADSMKPDHYDFEGYEGDGSVYRGSLFDNMVEEKVDSAKNTRGQHWPNVGILVEDDESIEHEILHRTLVMERGGKVPSTSDFIDSLVHVNASELPDNADLVFDFNFPSKYDIGFENCWVVRANTEECYNQLTEAAETQFWEFIRPYYTEQADFESLVSENRTKRFDEFLVRYLTPGDENMTNEDFEYYNMENKGYLLEDSLRRLEASSDDLESMVKNFARLDSLGVDNVEDLIEFCMQLPVTEDLEELNGYLIVDREQRKLSEYGVLPAEYH